jgi:hypothetical protein
MRKIKNYNLFDNPHGRIDVIISTKLAGEG